MSSNLLETLKNVCNNPLLGNAASSLNENESNVSKALTGIVPAVLGGIIAKATSGDHGPGTVLDLATASHNEGFLSNVSGLFNSDNGIVSRGMNMLKTIFGDKLDAVSSAISSYAGIKPSSATSLMSKVVPLAFGAIGDQAHQNGLNSISLTDWLSLQKNSVVNALPAALGSSLSGLLGLGSLGATASAFSSAASSVSSTSSALHSAETSIDKAKNGNRFLLPVLLAIGALILIIYLLKGCNNKPATVATTDTSATTVRADTTAAPVVTTPESIKVKLPNGVELDAYKGGIEDQLVAFLSTDYKQLGADSL